MEPNLTVPTAIDDVLDAVTDIADISEEALEELTANKEEGEDNE